jgi:hypothetical protein
VDILIGCGLVKRAELDDARKELIKKNVRPVKEN